MSWIAARFGLNGVKRIATIVLSAIFAFSVGASLWYSYRDQPFAFYLMPMRSWEFALGALVQLAQQQFPLTPKAAGWLTATGLLAILGTSIYLDDTIIFPGAIVLIPTFGASAVLLGGQFAGNNSIAARILKSSFMVRIGLLSYSWYLWHWPLLALSRSYFLGAREPVRDTAVVVLALVVAAASYHFVEYPIRYRKPWLFATRRGTFIAASVLTFFVLVLGEAVTHYGKFANGKLNDLLWSAGPTESNPFGEGRCKEPKDGMTLAPEGECTLGDSKMSPIIFAWGDSHIWHLQPMLLDYSGDTGNAIRVRTFGACPPVPEAVPFKKSEGQFPCGHFNENAAREMSQLAGKGVRGVILAARWNAYVALPVTDPGGIASYGLLANWKSQETDSSGDFRVGAAPLDIAGSASSLRKGVRALLTLARRNGQRVLIVAPTPELNFSGPQCLYRRSAVDCVVPRQKVDERRKVALKALESAVDGLDNVRLWDPIDQFCDSRICYAQRNGIVLFGDDNHISPAMSRKLQEFAKPHLDWLTETR